MIVRIRVPDNTTGIYETAALAAWKEPEVKREQERGRRLDVGRTDPRY